MNQIKQILCKKLNDYEKMKVKVEKSLKKAPKGSLVLSSSHGMVQYYFKDEENKKKKTYIDKTQIEWIGALAQKEYDMALQKEIAKKEEQIKKVLKILPTTEVEELFENLHTGRKKFVTPHFVTDEKYVEQWMKVKYTGKQNYDEFLKYTTEKGEIVRTKSEKIIADKLFSMGIPYRYEYPIKLKGYGTVYPDFTILKVSERREIYYEHFGLMDQPEYCEKALRKLQNYARNGIVLGENLIVTFESENVPLDVKVLEKMLENFL